VVSLLGPKSESVVFKLFKPLKEVQPDEVAAAVHTALEGKPTAQHLTTSAESADSATVAITDVQQ
jgi:recombinational DNA repair protein RecR